jgi:hypothetical protein
MSHDLRYRVRLTAATSDGDGGSIETERIDYYDSGVWVTVDTGRDFYPYERIAVIEERPAEAFEDGDEAAREGKADGSEAGDETTGDGEASGRETDDEGPIAEGQDDEEPIAEEQVDEDAA